MGMTTLIAIIASSDSPFRSDDEDGGMELLAGVGTPGVADEDGVGDLVVMLNRIVRPHVWSAPSGSSGQIRR